MAGPSKRLLAGIGAFAVTLAGASFAWACSAQPVVVFGGASGSASGPAGSPVTVRGEQWDAAPVEIRWNSIAGEELRLPNGQVARPTGPSFSVTIRIPADARTGVHTVYFVQKERDTATNNVEQESVTGTARLPFEVTPGQPGDVTYSDAEDNRTYRTSTATSGGDGSTGGRQATAGASGGDYQMATGPGERSGSTAGGEAPASPSAPAGESFGNLAPAAARPASGSEVSAVPAAVPQQRLAPTAAPGGVGVATSPSGQAVFGSSLPASSTAAPTASGAPGDDRQVSPRSATGDVWGGFDSGASLEAGLSDSTAGSSRPGSTLALSVGLLGAGLGIMFAGFGVAEVRRQRVLATRES